MRNWLNSILWRCRWYRRRKMRASGVWRALQAHPEAERFEFRINDDERKLLATTSRLQTKLNAVQLHRHGYLSDDALRAALDLETPAILTRGHRSFLSPPTQNVTRPVDAWPREQGLRAEDPKVAICIYCSNGHHGVLAAGHAFVHLCECPCHGGGAA